MSNVMAAASSDEQPSRAWELTNEIDISLMADAVWAAESLIEETEKAFKELNRLTKGSG